MHHPPNFPSQRYGDDSGANTLEYATVILLIAAITAVVAVSGIPDTIRSMIREALCRVEEAITGESCSVQQAEQERPDENFRPDNCLVHRNEEVAGISLTVVITLGEEISYITTEYSGGETHLTVMDTAALEASLGVGTGGDIGKALDFGAELSLTGGLSVENGSTWVFDSPEKVEEHRDLIEEHRMYESQRRHAPVWTALFGDEPEPLPGPDITRVSGEANLEGSATGGGGFGQRDSGQGQDSQDGGPSEWNVSPRLQVQGAIGVRTVVSEETDARTNETTTTYELGGTADVGADWIVGDWEEDAGRTGAMAITEDEDGNVTKVRLTQTRPGDNGPERVTNELEISSAEERRIVEEWLGLMWDDQVLPLTWDSMAPTKLGQNPTPFEELLFEAGRTSRLSYDQSNGVTEVSASGKFGVTIGAGGAWGNNELTMTEAEYLGSPQNRTREFVEWDTCQ